MHYLISAYVEKGDMLLNDAPFDGPEAYRRGITKPGPIMQGENGKNLWCFWRASKHYVINAWLVKSGMLPNYAPWCGLEAY